MKNIDTDIGKIYCLYNEATDDFTMMRLCKIKKEKDGPLYLFRYMDKNFKLLDGNDSAVGETADAERFKQIKKDWVVLKSDGIISLTNVISLASGSTVIKDVLAIYFPNNKATQVPDVTQPYIIARQGVNNIFASMAGVDEVGMSVSIDTLPPDYALSDFMTNDQVMDSTLCHFYKIDTEHNLSILLDNENSTNILNDLYDHAVQYKKNTIENYTRENIQDDCLDGYCNSIKSFLLNSGFVSDLYNYHGIIPVDFEIKENEEIGLNDRLYIATLCGGIKIAKCVPMKFDYSVNTRMFKIKYLMLIDTAGILYIAPYTESKEEITPDELYDLTEARTIQLHERLAKCVKAYDESKKSKDSFNAPITVIDNM